MDIRRLRPLVRPTREREREAEGDEKDGVQARGEEARMEVGVSTFMVGSSSSSSSSGTSDENSAMRRADLLRCGYRAARADDDDDGVAPPAVVVDPRLRPVRLAPVALVS